MTARLGVDVSDDQDATSFTKCDFVIVKLGEGVGYAGATGAAHKISICHREGIPVAGYWFLHPRYSGEEQAQLAIARARALGLYGIACDAEQTDGRSIYTVKECIGSFLKVAKSWGPTMLYANREWIQTFELYKLSVHLWESHPGQADPDFATQCFQYSFLGDVLGISAPVDRDRWTGSDQFFNAFFGLK